MARCLSCSLGHARTGDTCDQCRSKHTTAKPTPPPLTRRQELANLVDRLEYRERVLSNWPPHLTKTDRDDQLAAVRTELAAAQAELAAMPQEAIAS
jgi:hypothetical protein